MAEPELSGLAEYVNVPHTIGMVISSGKASMMELSTVLSLEDVHDIIEVLQVDSYNSRVIAQRSEHK
jgi:hypothetical protein